MEMVVQIVKYALLGKVQIFKPDKKKTDGCKQPLPPNIYCKPGTGLGGNGITIKYYCKKCKDSYSDGGKNKKCTPCPKDKPFTYLN